VPGGNAIYAALGMAVWNERPSVVAPFGPDYPTAHLEARIDLGGCPRIARSLRDWGLYEEDGSRQFIFRSATRDWDAFSPRGTDVPAGTRAAHLAPLPWSRHVELVAALRQEGATTISIDLDDRRLAEVDLPSMARLMAGVDLFLPSRQDGRVLFPDASPQDTVRRFRALSPDTPLIGLKCGSDGCVAHAAGSRELVLVPAVPVRAKDATGAGDAFCGGALVGYVRTRDCVEALLHGAVSASFCVETVGVTGLLNAPAAEARHRLETLRAGIETRPI
jgi:sugar/nucleoside kinase (ribokinase family)